MVYSSAAAAELLGCSVRQVQRIAARLEPRPALIRGALALTEADLERMRPLVRPVGNPAFVPGSPGGPGRPKKISA